MWKKDWSLTQKQVVMPLHVMLPLATRLLAMHPLVTRPAAASNPAS
jgi:hypothetical protein